MLLLLIWLGKHLHPGTVVTDRCFRIAVTVYEPPKKHHTYSALQPPHTFWWRHCIQTRNFECHLRVCRVQGHGRWHYTCMDLTYRLQPWILHTNHIFTLSMHHMYICIWSRLNNIYVQNVNWQHWRRKLHSHVFCIGFAKLK